MVTDDSDVFECYNINMLHEWLPVYLNVVTGLVTDLFECCYMNGY